MKDTARYIFRGGHSGGAGGAQATPGILIFQKQVTLFTKSGDTLELEWRNILESDLIQTHYLPILLACTYLNLFVNSQFSALFKL